MAARLESIMLQKHLGLEVAEVAEGRGVGLQAVQEVVTQHSVADEAEEMRRLIHKRDRMEGSKRWRIRYLIIERILSRIPTVAAYFLQFSVAT